MADIPKDEHQPVEAWCDTTYIHAKLQNGVVLSVPLWWYPRVRAGTPAQRNSVWVSPGGLHWNELDEDVAIQGMFEGWKAKDAVPPVMDAAE